MAVASEQRLVSKNGLHHSTQRKNLVQATWLVAIYLSCKGIRSLKNSKFELYDVITLDVSLVWKNGLHRWIQRKILVRAAWLVSIYLNWKCCLLQKQLCRFEIHVCSNNMYV